MEKFIEEIKGEILKCLPEEYEGARFRIRKSQHGQKLVTQLCVINPVTKCSSLVVTLDHYYEDYKNGNTTVKHAAKEAASSMMETMKDSSKFEAMLADYTICKDSIFIRLKNVNVKDGSSIPSVKITDELEAVCYVAYDTGEMTITQDVTAAILNDWYASFGEVFAQALMNTSYRYIFENAEGFLRYYRNLVDEDWNLTTEAKESLNLLPSKDFYILSNLNGVLGAGMLAVPEVLKKCLDTGKYFIAPISIHALIVTPYAENYTADLLRTAGRIILGKEIPMEEQLSDSIYIYEDGELSII